ncbi:centromere protein T-like [Salvelinus namaycush]|uniref:Centromere protein T-like n=1 Tax=Salvelinus namaycush TaxID=8040 RepID=A0A8U1C2J5_SALNM|nr:centromere protein T-like [Salvelinus namaycush]
MDSVDENVSARILLQNVIQTESSRSPITRRALPDLPCQSHPVRGGLYQRESGRLTHLHQPQPRFSMTLTSHLDTYSGGSCRQSWKHPFWFRTGQSGRSQSCPPQTPVFTATAQGLSELDLPDMTTTVNLSNTVKGLSRKRPRRSLNITAFNRQLEHEDGEGEGGSATEKDLSSLSSASPSSITFSLKTPFVDVRTEKGGFQRKVANRKKICLEEFDEALRNRQAAMGGDPELSVREVQQGLSETVRSEGFTLGLSDLTAPDITHDIITSNTALYAPPDDTATTFIIATQDKDTITGTQIQRGMKDEEEKDMEEVGEQKEDKMEIDNKDGEDLAVVAGQRGASVRQEESKSQTEEVADSQTKEVEEVADSRTGEDEELAKSQTEEEVAESPTEGEVAESPTEGEVAESPTEGEVAESPTEGEEEEMTESQTEDLADEGGQVVEGQEKGLTSQSLAHNVMHISRRAYCSEGGVKVAGVIEGGRGYKSMGAELHPTETGWAGRRSEGDTAGEWHSGPEVGASESAHTRTVTLGSAPPSPLPQEDEQELEGLSRTGTSLGNEEMENSMPPLEMTFEPENNAPHSSVSSLHPITAQSPADHEEDWDDVEEGDGIQSEELSMKTPAFVRKKRNALPIDPLATPTILKDLQPSVLSGAAAAVKPKAVRGKRAGSAKKDTGLSKSYIMSVFKHFAKTKVSTDVYPVLKEIMELYFDRLADDLEMFAAHAKRKTIEVEDVELLMRRQGFVTDSMPVNVLIEKYLPMESRKLLIPVATNGNYVIPKPRRK